MQIQRYIRTVVFHTLLERTLVALLYHIRSSSYFFFALLGPNGHPVSFGILKLLYFFDQYFVALRVFFDFGDHDLVEKVNFPEFLIVAVLLVVFGIDYFKIKLLGSVEWLFFMTISSTMDLSYSWSTFRMSYILSLMMSSSLASYSSARSS